MDKGGFSALSFSKDTYKSRRNLLIVSILTILFFEYEIDEFKIYNTNVEIPTPAIEFGLYLIWLWLFIQFLFFVHDDYMNWKRNFLISIKRQSNPPWPSTLSFEIHSFSKKNVEYLYDFSERLDKHINVKQLEDRIDRKMELIEGQIKNEIFVIENFNKWYKNYSISIILRFSILEFWLPIIFTFYAFLICRIYPLLPQ